MESKSKLILRAKKIEGQIEISALGKTVPEHDGQKYRRRLSKGSTKCEGELSEKKRSYGIVQKIFVLLIISVAACSVMMPPQFVAAVVADQRCVRPLYVSFPTLHIYFPCS